ncbi:MAG: DUF192 domain-containing protein, partial [Gaiella sp.]
RMWGLLGKRSLPRDTGLVLRPAFSIHTAFMRFPIDVVFLDPDQVVLRIDRVLTPFKTASCRGSREVVELAAGECERHELEVGHRITWAPRAAIDQELGSDAVLVRPHGQGSVVIATADDRFSKLAGFLLGSRDIDVLAVVAPEDSADAVSDKRPDVLVLDAGTDLADALREMATVQARRGETIVVVAAEGAAERRPPGMRVYDKWDETEELVEAVVAEIARMHEVVGD